MSSITWGRKEWVAGQWNCVIWRVKNACDVPTHNQGEWRSCSHCMNKILNVNLVPVQQADEVLRVCLFCWMFITIRTSLMTYKVLVHPQPQVLYSCEISTLRALSLSLPPFSPLFLLLFSLLLSLPTSLSHLLTSNRVLVKYPTVNPTHNKVIHKVWHGLKSEKLTPARWEQESTRLTTCTLWTLIHTPNLQYYHYLYKRATYYVTHCVYLSSKHKFASIF